MGKVKSPSTNKSFPWMNLREHGRVLEVRLNNKWESIVVGERESGEGLGRRLGIRCLVPIFGCLHSSKVP